MRFLALFLTVFTMTNCSNAEVKSVFERYLWQNRVLLVFAPDRDNDHLQTQARAIRAHIEDLKERDLVRWIIVDRELVTVNEEHKPQLSTPPLYHEFDVEPQKFTVILIGKDGTEKLRSHDPVTMERLFSVIDAMPMRQREMRERPEQGD